MKEEKSLYIPFILFHIILGIVIFYVPFLSKIYGVVAFLFGVIHIVRSNNKNNEVLFFTAYIVGLEVFLRMTKGVFLHEFGKYSVITYMILGIFYSGTNKKAFVYVVFLLLLVPAIFISTETLNYDTDFRKAIAFNLLGEVTLFFSALYCYKRVVSFSQVKSIITILGFPIISLITYLFLYTPDNLKDTITNTSSNFATSGGFGPNQVSTILGLGMFVFFVQILLNSSTKKILIINVILFAICSNRGIITFSRGGVYVGILMILILVFFLYSRINENGKRKINIALVASLFLGIAVWGYSSIQTGGMINKRYANQDAIGQEKASILSGREQLMETEIQMFVNNPIFGVGVGKNKEERFETTGVKAASHNEITRLLAEHGSFGIMALLILLFTPAILYLNNKQNIFLFSFLIFWLLTINHAAMRIAAPAFIYSLSLLKVYFNEEDIIHRQ